MKTTLTIVAGIVMLASGCRKDTYPDIPKTARSVEVIYECDAKKTPIFCEYNNTGDPVFDTVMPNNTTDTMQVITESFPVSVGDTVNARMWFAGGHTAYSRLTVIIKVDDKPETIMKQFGSCASERSITLTITK